MNDSFLCLTQTPLNHWELENYLGPYRPLREDVRQKALARLRYEGLDKCEAVTKESSPFFGKPDVYAMERYTYYQCFKCKKVNVRIHVVNDT